MLNQVAELPLMLSKKEADEALLPAQLDTSKNLARVYFVVVFN